MIEIYGHPFSSYTMKVLIALYANETKFELRVVGPECPENAKFLAANSGPQGKFPLLVDGDTILFESSTIVEYLALHHAGEQALLPDQPDAAIEVRKLDRVFDNYVMAPMQAIVDEHLRSPDQRDMSRSDGARARLDKSYGWLDGWLESYPTTSRITMIECAAVPALHYADWVHPIGPEFPRLRQWFAHLQALPPVKRCLDEAKPFRHFFPVPMPGPK